MKNIIPIIFLLFIFNSTVFAQQDRIMQIENQIELLKIEVPGLSEKVELSVNGVTLQEFLRGIANSYKVNINVSPELNMSVINNFSDVDVADLLVFLIKEYDLDVKFSGSIISFSKYVPPVEKIIYSPKKINAQVDSTKTLLSFDLKNDSLFKVFKRITDISGQNLVYPPGLENKLLSGYVVNMPINSALDKLAFSNNLEVDKTKDNFYIFSSTEKAPSNSRSRNRSASSKRRRSSGYKYSIINREEMLVSVEADRVSIEELIKDIGYDLGINIFQFSPLEGDIELTVKEIHFDKMLNKILENTSYTYLKQDEIYYIGEKKQAALRNTRTIPLMHRSVEGLLELIPKEITNGLEVKEAVGLNSLLVSGPTYELNRFSKFIGEIDKPIPVILIEVMFVIVKKHKTLDTGIEAGIGENPIETSGALYPNFNMNFGANTINQIIGSFTGFGSLNLGNVNPNFYLSLKALESNGNIKIQSTPRLSTLNGHKAVMTVGETTYFIEQRNDYVGSQIPQAFQTKNYKAIDAELKVEIKPIVAGDDQITLDILLEQSDFQGQRIEKGAPPGQNFRKFNSLIRVHNNDVVILGGLEVKSVEDNGSGVPLLARIPIIKWFFSSRKRSKSEDKLSLFIKPTVIQ